MHKQRAAKRAFTLIEILIVVVILGILAAIVIPQFTSAADDAKISSAKSQLQTARAQIELFKFQEGGLPTTNDLIDWDLLINGNYLHSEPVNPLTESSSVAAAAGAGVGWVWDDDAEKLYGVNSAGELVEDDDDWVPADD